MYEYEAQLMITFPFCFRFVFNEFNINIWLVYFHAHVFCLCFGFSKVMWFVVVLWRSIIPWPWWLVAAFVVVIFLFTRLLNGWAVRYGLVWYVYGIRICILCTRIFFADAYGWWREIHERLLQEIRILTDGFWCFDGCLLLLHNLTNRTVDYNSFFCNWSF